MADALPALGIVAAVLGIIRTMGAIDQSPAILGAMIGTALLGTFLGVFLAYGIVGPVATRYGQIIEEEATMLDVIRTVLSAHAAGIAPRSAIELGRSSIPLHVQPGPDALDHHLQSLRFANQQQTAA
jgi:chemotaxis protein MotA